ncbi:MAG: hypothetical protein ACOC7V_13125 [Spirochaetota bacterium]
MGSTCSYLRPHDWRGATPHATNSAQAGNNTPVTLVDTEWLAARLGNEEIHTADSQPDVHDYFTKHIPGA